MRRLASHVALLGLALAACSGSGARGSSSPATTAKTATTAATTATTAAPATTTTVPACVPAAGAPAAASDDFVPPLSAIQVVGQDEAWAVGASLIIHTADGGRTWTKQYGGPDRLVSVDMIDATHGWAVGSSGVLATDDGGACWSRRAVPSPALVAVHFVDRSLGWAVAKAGSAAPGVLVRSTDGGRTWTPQTTPTDVQSVCFTDAHQGWLVATGRLSTTNDGGSHWSPVSLATTRGGPWMGGEVQCTPGVAWFVATGGGAAGHVAHALYRVPVSGPARAVFAEPYTNPVDAPPSQSTYPGPLSAVGPSSAVVAGFTPALAPGAAAFLTVVVDDGRTIRPKGAPIPEIIQPSGASFASVDVGWVVGTAFSGGAGVLFRTTDGGRTWAAQYRTG